MKNELKYDFIASSKVIRYKLDPKAADVLAVLIYKHQYWAEQGELINFKGRNGFYISIDNIREETCFGKTVIQSSLISLKKEGLIDSKRQGLNKPNVYFLDINNIENYIKNHEAEYHTWKKNIRANKAISPVNVRNTENQLSRTSNSSFLEVVKSDTTKNKNTNNKITKTITNRINAEGVTGLFDCAVELEEKIETLRSCDNPTDIGICTEEIHKLLCSIVPQFKGFAMSAKDKALIAHMTYDGVPSWKISDKIISNAKAILEGKKESRFGNLLVGVSKMNKEFELKYG
jgi:DNA-binding transcriptional regulator GbsR (MarR family)